MENIKGIIISVSKYKDFDAIINILTENQIMPVLGRGIFKNENKNHNFIIPFIYGDFEIYEGKTRGYKLKTGKIIESFSFLFKTYEELIVLNSISEILNKATLNISYSELYKLTYSIFNGIKKGKDIFLTFCYFLYKICKLNGIQPNLDCCMRCGGKKSINSISFADGGAVCDDCKIREDLYLGASFKIFNDLFHDKYDEYNSLEQKETLNICLGLLIFIESNIGIKLISTNLINTLIIG